MQTQEQIAPHLEKLTRALGDKVGTEVSEDDLRDEFAKYLEYGVPVDQAIKTILRHHGVQGGPTAAPAGPNLDSQERVPLADVPGGVPYVNLLVRFVTLNTKTVMARGEEKQILWGLLGDETGTRPYTSWRALEGLEKGDVVAIKGAYTKEFNGEIQINFGDRCRLEKRDASELPEIKQEVKDVTVADLQPGLRGFRVKGRILDVSEREVVARGEPKKLWSGQFADETGKVEYTSWHDHGLEAGQAVTIEGGYIRSFRGVPQFNFDADAKIEKGAKGLPPAEDLDLSPVVTLAEVIERANANDITVVATLLEVRPGSGVVFRCSDASCSRVLANGMCRLHGKQEDGGQPDLRVKAVLDDGTGAINMVATRAITEQLTGKDLDTCLAEARNAMRYEIIQDQLAEKLTGRVFELRGDARSDDFGPMFITRSMSEHALEINAEARKLLADLDEAQEGL